MEKVLRVEEDPWKITHCVQEEKMDAGYCHSQCECGKVCRSHYEVGRTYERESGKTHVVYTVCDEVFWVVDGMCITLHEQSDVESWRRFSDLLSDGKFYRGKSMRLNVFKSVDVQNIPSWWKVKSDIEWIPNAPLPENESFMRYQKQRSERNGNSGYTGV